MSAPQDPAEQQADPAEDPQEQAPDAGQAGGDKDWKAEFEAQQRINRDIERRNGRRLKELETELEAAKKAKPADADKPEFDIEEIRQQIAAETKAEGLKDKAMDKLEAKAARLFKNPEDARTFLAGKVDDFIGDGKVDVDAISDALTDLLKERPYLAQGDDGKAPRFEGTADSGPRGSAGKPQLTEADVKRLYKEGKAEEIEAARVGGQLNTLLGIKA